LRTFGICLLNMLSGKGKKEGSLWTTTRVTWLQQDLLAAAGAAEYTVAEKQSMLLAVR